MNVPKIIVLICFISCCTIHLLGSTQAEYTEAFSDFTTDIDGWGGSADSFLSTLNAITAGNSYLRKEINTSGSGGLKSRLVVRRPVNSSVIGSDLWLGDFYDKQVSRVELNFNNWSMDETIYLRLALSNVTNPMISTGTWWVSTTYATFGPESGWRSASFNIDENYMKVVGDFNGGFGNDSFSETLSDIKGFRFIASSSGDSALGDLYSGAIGMDNIRLITSIPEPSTYAVIMGLLTTLHAVRRRRN